MGKRRKIGITIGDPAGIGPEVALKAIAAGAVTAVCHPVLIGDRAVLIEAIHMLSLPTEIDRLEIIDVSAISTGNFAKSKATADGGRASVAYIRKAVELATLGIIDAIVTAPITKEALKMAGFRWPGHTEMLAELTGTTDFAMMLCGGPLRIILVTIHVAVKDVSPMITKERVVQTIYLADRACRMLGLHQPRIAVAGLNPHAGESGMFGCEEMSAIIPAVEEARGAGISATGPYPADAVFHKAYKGEFDIIVCMYHDQGLIPLKMIAFDTGVNVTVGLPFPRTSPDHGTAYDIAWKGVASPLSMISAIRLAARLKRVESLGDRDGNAV